jgi:hypothetical protein
MTARPSPCPPADDLARLAAGDALPGDLARWGAHLEGCALCRAIVHGLGRREGAPPAPPVPPAPSARAQPPARPRSLWWVPWVTHALIALLVGLLGWWFLGR